VSAIRVLATLLLAASASSAQAPQAPVASVPPCELEEALRQFPPLQLPLVIDEKKWAADSQAKASALPGPIVAACLQQDSTYGSFFPIGRFVAKANQGDLPVLVARFSGPEDGYNDVYYLIVLGQRGALRSVLVLATFNGGPSYNTKSQATVRSGTEIETREEYAELASEDPSKVVRRETVRSCYSINWNGLPVSKPCR
jgi:hypothetical protein